jgi:hypothetical protein
MTSKSSCQLCGNSDVSLYWEDRQRQYFQCQQCQLVFVPEEFHLSEADEKAEYDKHQNFFDDQGYRDFLSRIFMPLNDQLMGSSKGLDFGCGPGPVLVSMFEEEGHYMDLYDKLYYPDESVLNKQYDFIVCTEVVEHLSSPNNVFSLFDKLIRPTGKIGVMTKLLEDKERFKTWHYKNDPTHISFYSMPTLEYIASTYDYALEVLGKDSFILTKHLESD